MFDSIVKMLCGVRYVPDLRKNLISFWHLNGNEFTNLKMEY